MKAYMSSGKRHSDDSRADTWNMAHAFHEAEMILAETEPDNPGPSGYMAHPGCYVWRAGLFCAECMTPIPRAALADALTAFLAMDEGDIHEA